MLAFKPKEIPILTKVARSGLFQFIMVVILGVSVTYFVIRTDRPQQWIQKINRFASVIPNNQTIKKAQNTEAGIAEDAIEFEAPPAAASAWAARSIVASGSAAAAAATPSTTTSMATSAAQNAAVALQMTETDNEYINTVMQKAFAANSIIQDSEIKIFIEPATSDSSAQKPSPDKMLLELNQVARKNYGTASRGFTINMTLVTINENAYSIRLQLNKIHPNDSLQIPLEFKLRKGDRLYITGYPLLSYFEFENDLANMPPFTILKSNDYRNQKTTFAIIIELL
ncbi:MAG: hypothetical protein V4654_10525 [Bdellovibrionota bacterium]